jgi:hypothetical protein
MPPLEDDGAWRVDGAVVAETQPHDARDQRRQRLGLDLVHATVAQQAAAAKRGGKVLGTGGLRQGLLRHGRSTGGGKNNFFDGHALLFEITAEPTTIEEPPVGLHLARVLRD